MYPSKVRVAIFTANFVAPDWESKTQGVWFQDFGLKTLVSDSEDDDNDDSKSETTSRSASTSRLPAIDFEADLVDYLSSLGAPAAAFCKTELARFDYSSAAVALLPSVPGVHRGSGAAVNHVDESVTRHVVLITAYCCCCCCCCVLLPSDAQVRTPAGAQVRSLSLFSWFLSSVGSLTHESRAHAVQTPPAPARASERPPAHLPSTSVVLVALLRSLVLTPTSSHTVFAAIHSSPASGRWTRSGSLASSRRVCSWANKASRLGKQRPCKHCTSSGRLSTTWCVLSLSNSHDAPLHQGRSVSHTRVLMCATLAAQLD